jgi:hypothetical protein
MRLLWVLRQGTQLLRRNNRFGSCGVLNLGHLSPWEPTAKEDRVSLFHKHKHSFDYPSGQKQEPLIVSGYAMTEYELLFCIKCGEIVWKLTKDWDRLYPKLKGKA